jgi:hypothetical protein
VTVRIAAATVLLLAGARSCGGGSAGPGETPPPATASELIDALCTSTGPCCALARRDDGGERCRSGLQAQLAHGVFDPRAGAACLTALRASTPEAICELVSAPGSPCQMAIGPDRHPGTTPPGGDCRIATDCAAASDGEVVCRGGLPPPGAPGPPPGPPPGTIANPWCEDQVRGKEGDGPCLGTVLDRGMVPNPEAPGVRPARAYLCYRQDNLQCDATAGSRCEKPRAPGDPCRTDAECGKDAYCRAIVFTCRVLIPVGSPCNSEVACVNQAYCPLDTRTCTAWLGAGAACTSDGQCRSKVCEGGRCAPLIDQRDWPMFISRFCAASDGGIGSAVSPDAL